MPDSGSPFPDDDSGGDQQFHDECYACPIGGFFLTARGASPEAFEHLVNAAAELVAAAKSIVEIAERVVEQQRQPGATHPRSSRVERIDLDG